MPDILFINTTRSFKTLKQISYRFRFFLKKNIKSMEMFSFSSCMPGCLQAFTLDHSSAHHRGEHIDKHSQSDPCSGQHPPTRRTTEYPERTHVDMERSCRQTMKKPLAQREWNQGPPCCAETVLTVAVPYSSLTLYKEHVFVCQRFLTHANFRPAPSLMSQLVILKRRK